MIFKKFESAGRRKFLGFVFDAEQQSVIVIPENHREKLLEKVNIFSQKSNCSIREFASLIVALISVCPTVRYGLLYTIFR